MFQKLILFTFFCSISAMSATITEKHSVKPENLHFDKNVALKIQESKNEFKEELNRLNEKDIKSLPPALKSYYLFNKEQNINRALLAMESAKAAILFSVEKNWETVQTGIININSDTSFKSFKALLKHLFDEELFMYHSDATSYYFQLADWGKIKVNKKTLISDVIIQYSYGSDKNKLLDFAYDLKAVEKKY